MFFRIAAPLLFLLYLAPMACSPSNAPGGGGSAATPEANIQTTQYTPPTPTATPMGGTIECADKQQKCAGLTSFIVNFTTTKTTPTDGKYQVTCLGYLSQIKYSTLSDPAETGVLQAPPPEIIPVEGVIVTLVTPSSSLQLEPTNAEGCFYASFIGNFGDLAKLSAKIPGYPDLSKEGALVGALSDKGFSSCPVAQAEQVKVPSDN